MKATLISLVVAVALAIPATALGAKSVLFGSLDDQPDSTMKLKVHSADGSGAVTVKAITFKNFTVSCDGGLTATMRKSKLAGSIPVGKRGGFKQVDDNGKTVFKIRGELNEDLDDAEGTFRFSGSLEAEDGATHECDTGRLSWTAAD